MTGEKTSLRAVCAIPMGMEGTTKEYDCGISPVACVSEPPRSKEATDTSIYPEPYIAIERVFYLACRGYRQYFPALVLATCSRTVDRRCRTASGADHVNLSSLCTHHY